MDASNPLRVLIFGKDARTDAMFVRCKDSPYKPELYVRTEFKNPRLRTIPENHVSIGSLTKLEEMLEFASEVRPHLAVIGPEEPLAIGLVDELEALGIPTFGPCRAAAQIETSKSWARQLVMKHQSWLNPAFKVIDSTEGLAAYLEALGSFVIKPDGLTGGKGVRLSGEHLQTISDAVQYADDLLRHHRHPHVIVEEKLEGEEFSLQTITDGESVAHCPIAQDHKRAFAGDRGPNTGGMGSYSCADFSLPFLTSTDVEKAKRANGLILEAIKEETGKPYRGVLYGNYISTRDGIKLIEYNARFADPEALNILPLLQTDFIDICRAVARGQLHTVPVEFAHKATVCKYVVPEGYPGNPVRNERIELRPDSHSDNLKTYFAAVNLEDQGLFLTGSRAVAFVGIGEHLEEAEQIAEEAASSVKGRVFHRPDIGTRALISSRIAHMDCLRGTSNRGSDKQTLSVQLAPGSRAKS